MQIPSVPPPIITNALPQDVVAKAVPVVQVTAPLLANAVAPPPKSEKSNHNRGSKDKEKDRDGKESHNDDPNDTDDKRGATVNISV